MATISKSLTVATKGGYLLTINVIPTGSSVTPVNDIQTWLHCADIWDKTYTTITQVLSDTSTLLALISSNNAADYMARSTSWASSVCANQTAMGYIGNNDYCANKLLADSTWTTAICNSTYFESVLNVKVPTMTSATAPSGEVVASNIYDGNYVGFYAFNGNTANGWLSAASSTPSDAWLYYKFASANKVRKFGYYNLTAVERSLKIQGSNNGTSWTDVSPELQFSSGNTWEYRNFVNNNSYLYYRVQFTNTKPSAPQYGNGYNFQFYGRA